VGSEATEQWPRRRWTRVLWRGFWIVAWANLAGGGLAWVARDVLGLGLLAQGITAGLGTVGGAWAAWDETR
jgi:hypothetical protein